MKKQTTKPQPSLFNRSVLWHNEELNKHQHRHKDHEKRAKLDGAEKTQYREKWKESKSIKLIKTVLWNFKQ